MADYPTRRRQRLMLMVWTLAAALAAWVVWAVRSRLSGRAARDRGWPTAPAPRTPAPVAAPTPAAAPPPPGAPPAPPAAAKPAARPSAPAAPQTRPSPTRRTKEPARARAVPTATTLPSVTADALPDGPFGPGSVPARADGSSPHPDYTIKGKTAARVFHTPVGPYYTRVRADVWFRSADDARAAGFTERAPRPRS
jgi:hypothetical protein